MHVGERALLVRNESGPRVIHQYAKAKGEVNLEQFMERKKGFKCSIGNIGGFTLWRWKSEFMCFKIEDGKEGRSDEVAPIRWSFGNAISIGCISKQDIIRRFFLFILFVVLYCFDGGMGGRGVI